MDDTLDSIQTVIWVSGSIVCAAVAGYFVYKRLKKRFRKPPVRICGTDYPKDKVIVHCPLSSGRFVPSMSHFVMKLETYLRVTNIPYEIGTGLKPRDAPKGKIPWIEYNGITMGDSQLIINYLNKAFNVDLQKSLEPQQRAMAWALQKWIEEFTYWLNVATRWSLYADEFITPKFISPFLCQRHIKYVIKNMTKKTLHTVGIGRHSNEDISDMMLFDLKQFSYILGDKRYLMGDSIGDVDCTAFGMLCQVRYQTPDQCAGKTLLNNSDDMKNVREYIDRIKTLYWSDWDDRLLKVAMDSHLPTL